MLQRFEHRVIDKHHSKKESLDKSDIFYIGGHEVKTKDALYWFADNWRLIGSDRTILIAVKDIAQLYDLEHGVFTEFVIPVYASTKNIRMIIGTSKVSSEILIQNILDVFPTRIVSKLSNGVQSRLLLGATGAEVLISDMEFLIGETVENRNWKEAVVVSQNQPYNFSTVFHL